MGFKQIIGKTGTKGELVLDMNNPKEREAGLYMAFAVCNENSDILNVVMNHIPKIKGFKGHTKKDAFKKMSFVYDLVRNLEKDGYKIVKQ